MSIHVLFVAFPKQVVSQRGGLVGFVSACRLVHGGVCVFLFAFFGVLFCFFSGVFRRIWENRFGVYSCLVAGLGVLDFVFFQKRGVFWLQ